MMSKLVSLFVPVQGGNKNEENKASGIPEFSVANKGQANTDIYAFLLEHKTYFLAFAIIASACFFFSNFAVMASFIAIGVASRYYQRFLPHISLGIETCIFGTVLSSLAFGWHAGAFVGAVSLVISVFLTEEEASYLPVAILGFVTVAYLAPLAPITAASIVFWGMMLTLFYDAGTCAVYVFVFHANMFKTFLFIGTHLAFNYFMFSTFGAYMFSVLI